jgi:hypothetical protein
MSLELHLGGASPHRSRADVAILRAWIATLFGHTGSTID